MPAIFDLTRFAPPREQTWHIPDLIPSGELVLLDGATGVGKSAFLAHLAANLTRQVTDGTRQRVLYITSLMQHEDRIAHLTREGAVMENLLEVEIPPNSVKDGFFLTEFYLFLEAAIREHQPSVVIIDQLEELVSRGDAPPLAHWQMFYKTLRLLVYKERCTVIIPRLHGTHEGRHYGHGAKVGTEFAKHIVALHWHPHDANQRVLTLSKRTQGKMGQQWHLRFDNDGRISLREAELHEHVRPAKSPQTWTPDPEHVIATRQIMEKVEEKMQGQPILLEELQEHIVKQGFTKTEYLYVMSRAKLPRARQGKDWYYQPTLEMATKQYVLTQEARAAAPELAHAA